MPTRLVTQNYGYDGDLIANVAVHKRSEDLLEYLRLINPRAEGLAVRGSTVYLDIGLETMMPLNMFGSGMMRAATILSPCILANDRILLIDELENGLHYQAVLPLLEVLLKLSVERRVQVIATTHSVEVLRALREVLNQEEFSGFRQATHCYTLQRDKLGLVRSYKYEYDQLDHCIAKNIEIRG